MNMRTTSPLESVNSNVQRSFPQNPHIFSFIQNLRLFDSIQSTDLYQLKSGSITNPRLQQQRNEDRRRDQKIKICTESLKTGKVTPFEFLLIMGDKDINEPSESKHSFFQI